MPLQPQPRYGLVCQTSDDAIRYRTITRTRLLALDAAHARLKLEEIYAANIAKLAEAIEYCAQRSIQLYRIPTGILPFADHAIGDPIVVGFSDSLAQVGALSRSRGVRLISHPDQFVVLSSESTAVVENSLRMLEAEARLFDMLGLDRSSWASINVHGGKGGRGEALVERIGRLPDNIRTRLTLENDERAYGAQEILDVCRAAGVAMIFDARHHLVRERLGGYNDPSIAHFTSEAATTWPDPAWQVVHISNGREHLHDPRHSDYISTMPEAFARVPFVEVEAKAKEQAVQALMTR